MTDPQPRGFRKVSQEIPNVDVIEQAVTAHAIANDVPSIVKPSDAPKAATASVVVVPSKERVRKIEPSPCKRIAAEVPTYVLKEIKRRVNEEGGTLKYHLLKALRDAGYFIKDVDLYEDGRRDR